MVESIKKWISHNQALVVSIVLASILLFVGFGCQVTTTSPFQPEHKVTRAQLQVEVENYAAQVKLASQDLDRKELILKTITDTLVAYTTTGGINPTGLIGLAGLILGGGAIVDNRRKDAVIKSKSNALDSLLAAATNAIEGKNEDDTESNS